MLGFKIIENFEQKIKDNIGKKEKINSEIRFENNCFSDNISPMDPELKGRLKVIEDKLEQNHRLLLRIRRVQRNATLFRLFYWVVVILIAVGAFYFIQPYIETFTSGYNNVKDSFSDLKNLNSFIQQVKGE